LSNWSRLSSLSSHSSSPTWKTWWDVLIPAIGVFVSKMDDDLSLREVSILENILSCLNVLDETIGGSTKYIRKATSALPESTVTFEHTLAFSRLKIFLVQLGFSRDTFKDVPLKVNMRPFEMFDLNKLRGDMNATFDAVLNSNVDREKKEDVFLAFQLFNDVMKGVRSIEESVRTLDLSG
jgi:hypothetical protein